MIKTKPDEFVAFHAALMSNAPAGYTPWYFPVVAHNKAPDGYDVALRAPPGAENRGNWKAPWARLTYEEALARLKAGKNVGLAARADDPLIIIDIDDYNSINLMPNTLKTVSRKRCGVHGFYWKNPSDTRLPVNIPTDYGEVRSSDQYVVAAGSHCETSANDIMAQEIPEWVKNDIIEDPLLGNYTVFVNREPATITFDELPCFFKERNEKVAKEQPKESAPAAPKSKRVFSGKHSALFDLTMEDIIPIPPTKRQPHPLHDSDTGQNFSVSKGLAHCWRHNVSLNPVQFLAVKSGYMSCLDAGTGHRGSGAGESKVKGDNGAIFHAWRQAKLDHLIPESDPVPANALIYIAYKHKLINKLPDEILTQVLKIIREEY